MVSYTQNIDTQKKEVSGVAAKDTGVTSAQSHKQPLQQGAFEAGELKTKVVKRRCFGCKKVLENVWVSRKRNMKDKPLPLRLCNACMQKSNQEGNNNWVRYLCCQCSEHKTTMHFSRRTLKRKGDDRRCIECTSRSNNATFLCRECSEHKSANHFSKHMLKKRSDNRCCLECSHQHFLLEAERARKTRQDRKVLAATIHPKPQSTNSLDYICTMLDKSPSRTTSTTQPEQEVKLLKTDGTNSCYNT